MQVCVYININIYIYMYVCNIHLQACARRTPVCMLSAYTLLNVCMLKCVGHYVVTLYLRACFFLSSECFFYSAGSGLCFRLFRGSHKCFFYGGRGVFVFSWLGEGRGSEFGAGYWDGVFFSPGCGGNVSSYSPSREGKQGVVGSGAVCLVILIVGLAIGTVLFLILPTTEGGGRGKRQGEWLAISIWTALFLILLAGEGREGGVFRVF